MLIWNGRRPIQVALAVFIVVFSTGNAGRAEPISQGQSAACAAVSFSTGTLKLAGSDSEPRPLTVGESVCAGSELQTDNTSRVELTFNDGGVLRLAESTTIELGAEGGSTDRSGFEFQVVMLEGKMWVNLSNRRSDTGFQILATGAVFSGPQSVFCVGIYPPDDAVEAKAYTGKVTAEGPYEIVREDSRYRLRSVPETGENPVEPWYYQIDPYWKMIVLSSGKATSPFRFAAKSDLTDWVRWNQKRDEGVK